MRSRNLLVQGRTTVLAIYDGTRQTPATSTGTRGNLA